MTDNGSCYRSKMFRAACKRFGFRQIFTRPYTPRTNGKGRSLHSDGTARMGLRSRLPQLGSAIGELLHWLSLELASSTW